MPPRASKVTPKKAAGKNTSTQDTTSNKRKIDWATIDESEPFPGFKVKRVAAKVPNTTPQANANKKRKTGKQSSARSDHYTDAPLDAEIVQRNPFPESDLSETHYVVEPKAEWESASRYRKFTSKCTNPLLFVRTLLSTSSLHPWQLSVSWVFSLIV
jgi:hypothetical protein